MHHPSASVCTVHSTISVTLQSVAFSLPPPVATYFFLVNFVEIIGFISTEPNGLSVAWQGFMERLRAGLFYCLGVGFAVSLRLHLTSTCNKGVYLNKY